MGKRCLEHLLVIVLLASLLCGCDKLPNLKLGSQKKQDFPVEGTIIAKVDGMPITLEQLDETITNYNSLLADAPEAQINTREQKLLYLNQELVRQYLLYEEAKRRGLDQEVKTQQLLRNLEISVLANQLIQKEINNIVVTSSEIESFYDLWKEQYKQEEERRISEIVFHTEAEAKEAMIELLKGADFAALAKERSRAKSASAGGDVGIIKKAQLGTGFSRFDEVAFSASLQSGQVSNIFQNDDKKYYIIQVNGIRGGITKPLTEVWDEIKMNVTFLKQQQKIQEITDPLLKEADVVIYEEKVK